MLFCAPWRHFYHIKQLAGEEAPLWQGHWIGSGRIETQKLMTFIMLRYISGNKDIELKKKKKKTVQKSFMTGKCLWRWWRLRKKTVMYLKHLRTDFRELEVSSIHGRLLGRRNRWMIRLLLYKWLDICIILLGDFKNPVPQT